MAITGPFVKQRNCAAALAKTWPCTLRLLSSRPHQGAETLSFYQCLMSLWPDLDEALPNAAKIHGFLVQQAEAVPLRAQTFLDSWVLQAVVIALQTW